MKKIVVLICLLVIGKAVLAQKDSLAFDEHGKYIYYRTVASKAEANVLLARGLDFFNLPYNRDVFKITAKDADAHTFEAKGFFMVSRAQMMAKHDDGKISFTVKVEVKDQKYRYWLTDFVFTPYVRDRYNNMVPQPGMDVPMEQIAKKAETKDADHYLDECAAFGRKFSSRFKPYMENGPVTVKKSDGKKVIDTQKW